MRWRAMEQLGGVAVGLVLSVATLSCGDGGEKGSPPSPSGKVDAPNSEVAAGPEATSGGAEVVNGASADGPPPAAGAGSLSGQLVGLLEGLPRADRERSNPLSGDAEAIKAGRSGYMSMCFVCHGAEGKGDGPAAKATPSTPSDLSDAARAGLLSDGDRFAVMRLGIEGTAMPASGANLNDDQVWRILAYVETLAKK